MAQGDITIIDTGVIGELVYVLGTMELSAAYSAGGVAVGTAKFGLTDVKFAKFEPVLFSATKALVPLYNRTTDKVMLFEGDGPTTAGPLVETDEALTTSGDLRFFAVGKNAAVVAS